jgi:UDP-GlcNAc:undecaprenyl-phosphate/decaprenyl-phosphate GlcNAc-1-phosphate transferase
MLVFDLLLVLLAATAALCFTWRVRGLARERGWTFAPTSDRHVHSAPVPRLGGVAIFLAVVLILSLHTLLLRDVKMLESWRFLGMAFSTTVLFCFGLYDDLHGLGPLGKVFAQVTCGVLLFWFGFRFEFFFQLGTLTPVFEFLLTILWVLIISNSFNLVDGIDGLAGGTALVSSASIFLVAVWIGETNVATAAAVLGGALAGFLWFNYHPASIFMGDCGSLFVGGFLAALSLALTRSLEPGFVAVTVPIMCCALPLFETLLSVTRRLTTGKHPFKADREHIHHRLLDLGFGQRKAAWTLHLLSIVCAVAVLLLLSKSRVLHVLAITVPMIAFIILAFNLQYHRSPERRFRRRTSFKSSPHYVQHLSNHLHRASDLQGIASCLESALEKSDFDGFELLTIVNRTQRPSDTEGPVYSWHRHGSTSDPESGRWNLSIELGTRGRPALGYLVLYREYSRGELEGNLDHIIHEMRRILASAIERALREQRPKYQSETAYREPYLLLNNPLKDVRQPPPKLR